MKDGEKLILKVLKNVMEERLSVANVQLASVTKERGYRIYSDEELTPLVAAL